MMVIWELCQNVKCKNYHKGARGVNRCMVNMKALDALFKMEMLEYDLQKMNEASDIVPEKCPYSAEMAVQQPC